MFLFVYVDTFCPSQQFFIHFRTFPGASTKERIKCLAKGIADLSLKIVFWPHKFAVGLIDMGNSESQDS